MKRPYYSASYNSGPRKSYQFIRVPSGASVFAKKGKRTFYYKLAKPSNTTRYYLRNTRVRRARALNTVQFGKRIYRRFYK